MRGKGGRIAIPLWPVSRAGEAGPARHEQRKKFDESFGSRGGSSGSIGSSSGGGGGGGGVGGAWLGGRRGGRRRWRTRRGGAPLPPAARNKGTESGRPGARRARARHTKPRVRRLAIHRVLSGVTLQVPTPFNCATLRCGAIMAAYKCSRAWTITAIAFFSTASPADSAAPCDSAVEAGGARPHARAADGLGRGLGHGDRGGRAPLLA